MKPRGLWLDPKVERLLTDSDALSMDLIAFRNGGSVNGERAVPFVEVTPEVRTMLRERFGSADGPEACERAPGRADMRCAPKEPEFKEVGAPSLAPDDCTHCGGSGDNDPSGEQGMSPFCPFCEGSGKRVPLRMPQIGD